MSALNSFKDIKWTGPKKKVIIRLPDDGGAYRAEVPDGLDEHEVTKRIQKALKARKFSWYYLADMLELKLED